MQNIENMNACIDRLAKMWIHIENSSRYICYDRQNRGDMNTHIEYGKYEYMYRQTCEDIHTHKN